MPSPRQRRLPIRRVSIRRNQAPSQAQNPMPLNALSGEMMAGLQEAIPRLGQDPKVRALVLTGAGDAFCAGGDVKGFARTSSGSQAPQERPSFDQRVLGLRNSTEMIRWLHEMPKPTLAAIPGPAAGGGLSFALACDLRIAVETAFLTTAFVRKEPPAFRGR